MPLTLNGANQMALERDTGRSGLYATRTDWVAEQLTDYGERLANPLSKGQKYVPKSRGQSRKYSNVPVSRQTQLRSTGASEIVKVPAKTYVVDLENAGRRLDNYLATIIKNVPKSYIYKIIRRGEVRVNGGRRKAETKLQLNDQVRVPPHQQSSASTPVISQQWRRSLLEAICFEDEDFVVLNKPAGLAVHAGSGKDFGVIEIMQAAMGPEMALVHRLDMDTSGCLLVAKRASVCRRLQAQFRENSVKKTYRALVRGHFDHQELVTEARLKTQRGEVGQAKTWVDQQGKTARSRFRLLTNFATDELAAAYVEISIDTGRTHQIRVHAAHLGHPVCADERYGDPGFNQQMTAIGATRLFLHAAELKFTHPITNSLIAVSADEPPDLIEVRRRLAAQQVQ